MYTCAPDGAVCFGVVDDRAYMRLGSEKGFCICVRGGWGLGLESAGACAGWVG